eukprot:7464298-Pyramimonas_sp.AAC.3
MTDQGRKPGLFQLEIPGVSTPVYNTDPSFGDDNNKLDSIHCVRSYPVIRDIAIDRPSPDRLNLATDWIVVVHGARLGFGFS